jgi:uncharacterized protein (TIGR02001 family)
MMKILRASLLSGAAIAVMGSAAFAADLGGSMKDEPAAPDLAITVNGGFTTDYVFRGTSQTDNTAGVFAGADLAYKIFYVGVWGASVDTATSVGEMEMDVYAGIKPSWNGLDFDLGVIYYGYPGGDHTGGAGAGIGADTADPGYVEFKAGVSTKILKDLTIGATLFYSPDYYLETGATTTVEGKLSKPLPIFDIVASGALGHVSSNDDNGNFSAFYGDDNYTYWNVGLSKTFRDHYTFDVRYWNTDVDENAAGAYLTGDRIVGTFTFNY